MLFLFLLTLFPTFLYAASPLEMHCQMVFAKRRASHIHIKPGVLVSAHLKGKRFKIFDVRHEFYFIGELENRQLELNLFLSDHERLLRSGLQGERLYREMMDYFGVENIDVIIGRWHEGTNYDEYFLAKEKGLSPEEAVFQTWSGRQAESFGFRQVHFVEEIFMDDMSSPQIYVEFIK